MNQKRRELHRAVLASLLLGSLSSAPALAETDAAAEPEPSSTSSPPEDVEVITVYGRSDSIVGIADSASQGMVAGARRSTVPAGCARSSSGRPR